MLALGANCSGVICHRTDLQMGITTLAVNQLPWYFFNSLQVARTRCCKTSASRNRQLQITQCTDVYAKFSAQYAMC